MNDKIDIEKMLNSVGNEEVPSEISDLSSRIISDFGRAVEVAEIAQSYKSLFVNWIGGLCYRFAAGAAFALVIIAAYFFMTRTSSIAWADVVSAMGKVDQMRAKVIVEDPRSKDEKIFTIEMFYKSPDKCRAHGRGFVQFINGDVNRIFSVEKKELLKAGTRYPTVIPHGFMGLLKKKGLLVATLEMIFQGKVPSAEPVISTSAIAGEGIEVFDYANNANEMWARVWVLKKSRLPVRMKIFYPERDESTLVIFDYTGRHRNEFFDIDKFITEAKSIRSDKPYRFYNIGKGVVTADPEKPDKVKPTTPVHIHKIEGINPPKLLSVTKYDNNVLIISASDPQNLSKRGQRIDSEYHRELRDNWGNIYLRYHTNKCGLKGEPMEMYYIPVLPLKKGQGVQKIKLLYTARGYYPVKPGSEFSASYDKVISNREVEINEQSKEFPKTLSDRYPHNTKFFKRQANRIYMTGGASLNEQWDYVNSVLKESPDSEQMLQWKMKLLREFEGEAAAFKFYENNLFTKQVNKIFPNIIYGSYLPEYLVHLYNNGRADEYYKYANQINIRKKAFLKSKRSSSNTTDQIKSHQFKLSKVLEIPSIEKLLKKAVKPRIVKTAVSADGKVLVSVDFSKNTTNQRGYYKFSYRIKNAVSGEYGTCLCNGLYQFDTSSNKISLGFESSIESFLKETSEHSSSYTKIVIPVEIKLPKASSKNVNELKGEFDVWQQHLTKIKNLKHSERFLISKSARKLLNEERYDEALVKFEKVIELLNAEIEKGTTAGDDVYMSNQSKGHILLDIGVCLAKSGRVVEAYHILNEADRLSQEKLDGIIKTMYSYVRIVEYFIDKGKLDLAGKLLGRVGKDKPNLREYENYRQVEKKRGGYHSSQKRYDVYSKWRPYYIAEWKLREAREKE